MKACKCCGAEKDESEFYAVKANKDGLATACKACYAEKVRARYHADIKKARAAKTAQRRANPEKYKAISLAGYYRNRDHILAKKREYVALNKDAIREKKRAARLADPEKATALKRAEYARNANKYREYRTRYYAANKEKAKAAIIAAMSAAPDKYRAHRANRKARKANATPLWFNEFDAFAVEEAYALADKRAAVVGGGWQVDHIIPIAGRKACGLHVGLNFQVLPAPVNNRKRNRFDPSAHSEVRDAVFVGV